MTAPLERAIRQPHSSEHPFALKAAAVRLSRTYARASDPHSAYRTPIMRPVHHADVVTYAADFEHTDLTKPPPRPFNLTVVCIPTAPGWSRTIIYQGKRKALKETALPSAEVDKDDVSGGTAETTTTTTTKKKKSSPVALLLGLIPVWLIHIFANRFLDSDLAFLHYQVAAIPTAVPTTSLTVRHIVSPTFKYTATPTIKHTARAIVKHIAVLTPTAAV